MFIEKTSLPLRLISFLFFFFPMAVWSQTTLKVQGQKFKNIIQDMKNNLAVEKYQLHNGLTVLLHEDRSVPLVSVHQWFRVGSVHEKEGRTGLAHFFEHLMFKGTTKRPTGQYEQLIHSNGGSFNAFTSRDYTGYFCFLPSDKLDLALDIESDRMRNLLFSTDEINSEREVVKEERRVRYDNDIRGALQELLFSTVFKTSQYRWPVIGSMDDLNATSIDELKAFYKTYYAPNNAVLVIAGAFDIKTVKKRIEHFYGAIPSQPVPALQFIPEVAITQQRRASLRRDIQNQIVHTTFHAPPLGHKDNYALDLLASIFSEGPSSRLSHRLVYKDQLLTSINSYNSTLAYKGLFGFTADLKPKVSLRQVENIIKSEVERIKNHLVSLEELEKAKNQMMTSYVSALKTIGGKARALALNEIYFKDYTVLFKDLENYQSVTAQDIQRVAREYLDFNKSAVVYSVPTGGHSR